MDFTPLLPFETQMQFDRLLGTKEACERLYIILCFQGCPPCPKCGHKAYAFRDGIRFKCKNNQCYKVFSFKVGTIFENSKIPMNEWFKAIYMMLRNNVSSHMLPGDIGVTQSSAWFALHRLRHVLDQDKEPVLLGKFKQVKADEGTFGGANTNKHVNKQLPGTQGRSGRGKKIFAGACESDGDAVLKVVNNTSTQVLLPFLKTYVCKGAELTTDEWTGYDGAEEDFDLHRTNHGAKQYVNGKWHSNDMENLFFHFFTDMSSTHIHFSEQHAQAYADYFAYCWNTRKVSISSAFIIFLLRTVGCRLTYRELIRKKDAA